MAKRQFRDLPFIRPFSKLAQQAKALYSSKRPEDNERCIQHSHRLRTEFQTLRILIGRANDIVRERAELTRLKTGLMVSTLETLILKDTFRRTAKKAAKCIERKTGVDAEDQLILKELRAYADTSLPSLIEELANHLVLLLKDILEHEVAVQRVQDSYFDGNQILFRDMEDKLTRTIKRVTDAVERFNAYLKVRSDLFDTNPAQEVECEFEALGERGGHLQINIEKIRDAARLINVDEWMKKSREEATLDILRETGEEAYRLRILLERLQE